MNVQEGARRMRRAGQWLIMVPLTAFLTFWGISLAVTSVLRHALELLGGGAIFFLFAFIYLAILGGALWLAGWIMEGFAKENS